MNRSGGRPLRIAHAFGNRRDRIDAAIAADVDFIEADLWYRAGEIWVRHERRPGFLPLLYDRKPRGMNSFGPWSLTVFPNHYIRLDVRPLRLVELLEATRGKRRLLLDLKDDHPPQRARAYAGALARLLREAGCAESALVCGQTDVLDSVRKVAPELDVRYSIERQRQWETFLRRLDVDAAIRGVCLQHEFLTDPVARLLEQRSLEVFCWTVDDREEARRLAALGVDGIISNDLTLLAQLGRS
ncbi:MAG: glycerophosphodiester phosphodiesterase [Dehalococcoidia bacterium]|nr:glycerophosphodiester phosphodiesterase [Dehalococcoidia bacterium]